ncbi:MAG: Zn-ribbon domain-containing OB-fold protein [Candidatus Binatia bacterium]
MTGPYLTPADPYPFQSPELNCLHEFYAHLRGDRLTTTQCRGCGNNYWPPRRFCPQCLSGEFDWIDLPKEGTIHAFTIQESGVPRGFSAP